MNWEFIRQSIPLYQEAFLLTLIIAFGGVLGAFFVGLLVSVIRHYRIPILQQLSTIYIEFSRNTPLLIQLFFLYFGFPRLGIILSSRPAPSLV